MLYRARGNRNMINCRILFENNKHNMEFIIYDTETSGLDAEKDYIVQLAAIKYAVLDGNLEEIARMDMYLKPPKKMSKKATEVNGITDQFLADKPAEQEKFAEIFAFFGTCPILCGYNVGFDTKMLSAMYSRNGVAFNPVVELDVLEMMRDICTDDVSDYKLQTISEMLGLDAGVAFHDAYSDVIATSRLLQYAYNEYRHMEIPANRRILYVNYMYFWKGFNKEQSGLYIDTTEGRLYFSTFRKAWFSNEINLKEIDIDQMEKVVLQRTGLESMSEVGRLTENKYKVLKTQRRQAGVYL